MMVLHAPPHLQKEGEALCASHHTLEGHLFATSGTTGSPKWILHSQAGLDWCADTINDHLSCSGRDIWGLALPPFHVGGFCLGHRAARAGGGLAHYSGKWCPHRFHAWATQESITVVSLVPTQVVDLVTHHLSPPPSLRIALVGGDHLQEASYLAARKLSWPLRLSYGMTETAGLVACSPLAQPTLAPIPGWELTTESDNILTINGPGLFSGQLTSDGLTPGDRPFRTTDRAEINKGQLSLRGRADDQVKVLGELVDLSQLRKSLAITFPKPNNTVVPIADPRRGFLLFAVFESLQGEVDCQAFAAWNRAQPPFARLEGPLVLPEWERNGLGKVDRKALAQRVANERDSLLPPAPRPA